MAKIGKNILENLTTGMYADSKVTYREYVQNACDQIDKAVKMGLITSPEEAEVDIFIDDKKRYISISDNATGVEADSFVSQLGDIANSDKKIGENKGFRGIGRLCGLAYCKTLVFTTSYKGENKKSRMEFDAKLMREMLQSDTKYTIDEILEAIVKTSIDSEEDCDSHYFKVELFDINQENTDLLDDKKVRDYLSFVAPVPYTNKFLLRSSIKAYAKEKNFAIEEYIVKVNGAQLFKEYTTRLYEGGDTSRRVYDNISQLAFKDFFDETGQLIAWAWYGLSRFEKAIPKSLNPMYGFRLRQGNIQIGDNTVVSSLFKEPRGNSYFVGEIFAVSKGLIPNSQRNYFNETKERVQLEDALRDFFYDELHKLYHVANETKNDFNKIIDYNDAVQKLQEMEARGFVDSKEKAKMEAEVEATRQKKDQAVKRLEKAVYKQEDSSDAIRTPEQIVRQAIKKKFDPLIEVKVPAVQSQDLKEKEKENCKDAGKAKYFTENLSKLDRNKRKLVQQIMTIVNNVAPQDIAEEIRKAIEKEFR